MTGANQTNTKGGRRNVDPIRSTPTLVSSAADAVRQSIYDGRLGPGDRLVEADLARQLGISRGPLREALHLLGKEGLVVGVPRHAKFVPDVDAESIDEVYTLHKVLEGYAVERVMTLAGPSAIKELREALDEMKTAAEAGDKQLTARLDIAFHSRLFQLASHGLLERAWHEDIVGKLQILFNATKRADLALKEPVQQHDLIVKAIAGGDVQRARAVVSSHIDSAWQRARRSVASSELRSSVPEAVPADTPTPLSSG